MRGTARFPLFSESFHTISKFILLCLWIYIEGIHIYIQVVSSDRSRFVLCMKLFNYGIISIFNLDPEDLRHSIMMLSDGKSFLCWTKKKKEKRN